MGLSERRKYRSWMSQQKLEIVLAGLRGDGSVKEVCREHEISETLYCSRREKLLEGGREALAGKDERRASGSCAGMSGSSSGSSAAARSSAGSDAASSVSSGPASSGS